MHQPDSQHGGPRSVEGAAQVAVLARDGEHAAREC
jgi:hypothetical protein